MHICLVSCAYAPIHGGGVAVSLSLLAKEFIKSGIQVSVFTIDSNISKKDGEVSVKEFDSVTCYVYNSKGTNVDFFDRYKQKDYYNKRIEKAFRKVVLKVECDVVHFHAIQGMGANLLNVSSDLNLKSFVSFHDFWWVCPNLFYTDHDYEDCSRDCSNCHIQLKSRSNVYKADEAFYIERREYLLSQLKKVDVIFSNSNYLKSEIAFWDLPNIRLNENGVDIPSNVSNGSPKGTIVIGFVGGESELKGYSIVLDAFDKVENQDVRLHIHGTSMSTMSTWRANLIKGLRVNPIHQLPRKLYSRLRSKREQTDGRVKIFGTYGPKEKYDVFRTFDALIVGTRVKESFSLVTREAQILGIPVITSDCGGPLDVIEEGKNGYVYERNSSTSLTNAINRYLSDRQNGVKYLFSTKKITSIKEQAQELTEFYFR